MSLRFFIHFTKTSSIPITRPNYQILHTTSHQALHNLPHNTISLLHPPRIIQNEDPPPDSATVLLANIEGASARVELDGVKIRFGDNSAALFIMLYEMQKQQEILIPELADEKRNSHKAQMEQLHQISVLEDQVRYLHKAFQNMADNFAYCKGEMDNSCGFCKEERQERVREEIEVEQQHDRIEELEIVLRLVNLET
ncbi:hypothetical protein BDW59DRAFT_111832 [Aspergillus cavernicola]|uniref:Uncharacterized protein n=1 Tax=Aspergillus cavernicola TaxID=176166 RepID=A0ABR4HZN2_9EURO